MTDLSAINVVFTVAQKNKYQMLVFSVVLPLSQCFCKGEIDLFLTSLIFIQSYPSPALLFG